MQLKPSVTVSGCKIFFKIFFWIAFSINDKHVETAFAKSLLLVHEGTFCLSICRDFQRPICIFQSVPRFILRVGLSVSILHQPQGCDRDSLTANEICKDMHRGTIHVYLTCLHVLQLLLVKNCHMGTRRKSWRPWHLSPFIPFQFLSLFMSLNWQWNQFNCNITWHLLGWCVPLQRKWRNIFWTNVLWTSLRKQIPSLKEAYYSKQLKIY